MKIKKCSMLYQLYVKEARIFSWLFGQDWFQRRCNGDAVQLVEGVLDETGLRTMNPSLRSSQIVRRMLLGDRLRRRWINVFRANPVCLRDLVTVHGQEIFERAIQENRGVLLLLTHGYATHLVHPWLSVTREGPLLTINYQRNIDRWKARRNAFRAKLRSRVRKPNTASATSLAFSYAAELHRASECLRKHGVVCILADGYAGSGKSIPQSFYGHDRLFHVSFAELAVRTDALVLPCSTRLDLDGHVQVIYRQPLNTGAKSDELPQRVEHLTRQYVDFLASEWRNALGDVNRKHLQNYLTSTKSAPL